MKLGTWLVSLASPISKTVMRSLGFGVVTMAGVDVALTGLLGQAKASWSGLPAEVASYVAMAGVNTGLAILAGAVVGRIALIPLKTMRLL